MFDNQSGCKIVGLEERMFDLALLKGMKSAEYINRADQASCSKEKNRLLANASFAASSAQEAWYKYTALR